MSTSDKLTYLNGTKQELKQAINNLGGDITSETTFREYAQELQDIYDNIPKTTDTGTNLSLSTIKGKMNIQIKGDTEQYTTTGKNLLKSPYTTSQTSTNNITLTIEEDMKIKLTGTANADGGVIATLQNPITLNANTTYTFSLGTGTKQTGWGFYLQNSNNVNLYYIGVSSTSTYVTFTPTQDVVVAKTSLHFTSGTTMNTTIYLQLEKGSSATSYEMFTNGASPNPSYPQDIEVVTGTQEVKVENVNKLPYANEETQTSYTVTHKSNGDGTYIINGTATNGNSGANLMFSNMSYTIQSGDYLFLGNTSTNGQIALGLMENVSTQITSKGAGQLNAILSLESYVGRTITGVKTFLANGNTANNFELKPMIIHGNTATTHTPHQEQTQVVSLGDIELCKIGTYQDYIYKSNDKWYKKEYIGKVVLNGSENWTEQTQTGFARYGVTNIDIINDTSLVNTILNYSNYFTGITFNQRNTNVANTIYTICNAVTSQSAFWINTTETTSYSSLATFKTWLSTHNVEVYYVLATPQDIEITNETLVQQLENMAKLYSYNGTTNITSTSDTGCDIILSVSALKGA